MLAFHPCPTRDMSLQQDGLVSSFVFHLTCPCNQMAMFHVWIVHGSAGALSVPYKIHSLATRKPGEFQVRTVDGAVRNSSVFHRRHVLATRWADLQQDGSQVACGCQQFICVPLDSYSRTWWFSMSSAWCSSYYSLAGTGSWIITCHLLFTLFWSIDHISWQFHILYQSPFATGYCILIETLWHHLLLKPSVILSYGFSDYSENEFNVLM